MVNKKIKNIVLKKVPIGFNYPLGKLWFGYLFPTQPCELCNCTGHAQFRTIKYIEDLDGQGREYICPVCDGKGNVSPMIEVPKGEGYQIWETQENIPHYGSNFYPLSPVFNTAEELAEWCSTNLRISNDRSYSKKMWLKAINSNNVGTFFHIFRNKIECIKPEI